MRGTHVGLKKVRYFRGTRMTVETDPPVELQLDGDLAGHTPATFQLKRGALRVLTPR